MWLLQTNILLKKHQQQSKAKKRHKAVAAGYNVMPQGSAFLFPCTNTEGGKEREEETENGKHCWGGTATTWTTVRWTRKHHEIQKKSEYFDAMGRFLQRKFVRLQGMMQLHHAHLWHKPTAFFFFISAHIRLSLINRRHTTKGVQTAWDPHWGFVGNIQKISCSLF